MYGKSNEALFDPPIVIVCTNQIFEDHSHYLSQDRQLNLEIKNGEIFSKSFLHLEFAKELEPFKEILESKADSPISPSKDSNDD